MTLQRPPCQASSEYIQTRLRRIEANLLAGEEHVALPIAKHIVSTVDSGRLRGPVAGAFPLPEGSRPLHSIGPSAVRDVCQRGDKTQRAP